MVAFEYDLQGNVRTKNDVSFNFDLGNRLRSTSGGVTSSYVYDALGRRVRDVTTASKYSLYTQGGQLAYASDARAGRGYNYIYLGGSLVAERSFPTGTTNYTVEYQHTDALGTPVATSTASKQITKSDYEPYGKVLNRAVQDGPGFTGHVEDAATGLVQMQQRYYDPIGRFLSVDPVTALDGGQLHFNRYDYAYNNPYKFTDPDGRCPFCIPVIIFGAGALLHSEPANAPAPGERTQVGSPADAFDAVPGGGPLLLGAKATVNMADKGLRRPYVRKGVRAEVEQRASRSEDGRPIDPNTRRPIDGKPDLGHKPGSEHRTERANAEAEGLSQKQFNDRMNNPDKYQLEDPSSNRSHRYEEKPLGGKML